MNIEKRIHQLIKSSKEVFFDCALDNGGIVAADSSKQYYPAQAKNYFYIWPRDASYICMAAWELGIRDIQEPFLAWIRDRAEEWRETSLLFKNYHPQGIRLGRQFQPDQQAMVICMIDYCARDDTSMRDRNQNLVEKAADGLASVWNGNGFTVETSDIWERRHTFPETGGSHIYSLAACARALHIAHEMSGKSKYEDVACQMATTLWDDARCRGYLIRTIGRLEDPSPDVAQLGVFWPFDLEEDDGTVRYNTLDMIEKACVEDYRVFRFPGDIYDGWVAGSTNRNQGAGYWPLLNFWMTIVLHRTGRQEDAKKYFTRVLQDAAEYIPEQIFDNVIQQGVSPLAWSHAMFVLAAKELGYLEKKTVELAENAHVPE